MELINDISPKTRQGVQVTFDFTPKGAAFTYTIGGTTYGGATHGAYRVAVNTAITFTATTTFYDAGYSAVVYRWDFGDGVEATGNPAVHTFKFANPHTMVTLVVEDNDEKLWTTRRQLYVT